MTASPPVQRPGPFSLSKAATANEKKPPLEDSDGLEANPSRLGRAAIEQSISADG
jgi:hypothetical protein